MFPTPGNTGDLNELQPHHLGQLLPSLPAQPHWPPLPFQQLPAFLFLMVSIQFFSSRPIPIVVPTHVQPLQPILSTQSALPQPPSLTPLPENVSTEGDTVVIMDMFDYIEYGHNHLNDPDDYI